jgi:hypothetical protein
MHDLKTQGLSPSFQIAHQNGHRLTNQFGISMDHTFILTIVQIFCRTFQKLRRESLLNQTFAPLNTFFSYIF